MRSTARGVDSCLFAVLSLLGIVLLTAAPGWSKDLSERKGLWVRAQFGYGSLDLSSNQESLNREGTFAMALAAGGTLGGHVRFGGQLHGWLLEASGVWDPSKGVSVSGAVAIAELYPWSARGLFARAGLGRAYYTNHHPLEFGSSGWSGTVGVGWDVSVGRKFALTPVINYSRGGLGDVENQLATIRNREFGVFDIGIAITYN